jgi:glutathione S-transferase
LALYQVRSSPECIQIRREIIRLGLTIEVRDAQLDFDHRQALEQEGGKLEAPCLRIARDDGPDEWLYEAEAIKRYLHRRFGVWDA